MIAGGVLDTRMIRGLCVFLCVLLLHSRAQAVGSCTVYILCVCIYIYIFCSAQQDSTRPGLISHSSQAVNPHKRHQTIKKVNSRKHIQHDASLLLHFRCV